MNNETLTARASIKVRSTPAKVFAAFAEADQMSRFWFSRSDDGLRAGEPCAWALGAGPDAFTFEVEVIDVHEPEKIVIEWPTPEGGRRQVQWSFEPADDGHTILTIEESGFDGISEATVREVLNSTGGFNQVIVAAKAWVEYGEAVNVVADHA